MLIIFIILLSIFFFFLYFPYESKDKEKLNIDWNLASRKEEELKKLRIFYEL